MSPKGGEKRRTHRTGMGKELVETWKEKGGAYTKADDSTG